MHWYKYVDWALGGGGGPKERLYSIGILSIEYTQCLRYEVIKIV